ncbi:MAG: LPS export ABC transporter periplasmic protein LptC [Planctomycetales bacterium]|nr:LPS export ABC transporter periplasmic protein LptC [bacterium]UNM07420.1 MAG: LPS export ABC transporter periplasmic protein LptC [Planctomycetales bacterium]
MNKAEKRRIADRRRRIRETIFYWIRQVFTIAAIVASYYLVQYVFEKSTEEVAAVKEREDSPWYMIVDKEGERVSMSVVDDSGQLSMKITGDSVKLTTDQKTAEFENADAEYFEDGKLSIAMHAGKLTYDTQSEDFVLDTLNIETSDGMHIEAPFVEWRRVKDARLVTKPNAAKVPSFRFPQGVYVENKQDGNSIRANYMQADKELRYMEFVGKVEGSVSELSDTQFIEERELTDVGELNLEDIKTLGFKAEEVIYDMNNQVIVASTRLYDRRFNVRDMDGRDVRIEDFQKDQNGEPLPPTPLTFTKEEITITCHHLEAHIGKKWLSCVGEIEMLVPPSEPKPDDDNALRVVKRYETRIASNEIEYFWGRDYILTHSRTRVEQEDRLAMADRITYWGDQKMVLLNGAVTMVQGDGSWLVEEDLISVDNHDMERAVRAYMELTMDRAVVYLNNNDFIASGDVYMKQDERETHADTLVYQDEDKRITADGNVKFVDKDSQTLLCNSLVFHKNSDFIEIQGGMSATLRIPAKFANDINKALAETREKEVPAEVTDPPVSEEVPTHNPNSGSVLASNVRPLDVPKADADTPDDVPALPVPNGNSSSRPAPHAEDGSANVAESGGEGNGTSGGQSSGGEG